MKKYLRMSSAAVVIGALRVKIYKLRLEYGETLYGRRTALNTSCSEDIRKF